MKQFLKEFVKSFIIGFVGTILVIVVLGVTGKLWNKITSKFGHKNDDFEEEA